MTDVNTDIKIADARLILKGANNTLEGSSNSEGLLTFRDIAPDTYTLEVEKDGYEDFVYPQPITILPDTPTALQLNIKLVKITGSTITANVVAEDTTVTSTGDNTSSNTTSDTNTTTPTTTAGDSTTTPTNSGNTTTTNSSVTLNIDSNPLLAGIGIQLLNQDTGAEIGTATTDDKGNATISNVPYGSFLLKAVLTGYQDYNQIITIDSTSNNPRAVTISLQKSNGG